jgi:hypothetical protein
MTLTDQFNRACEQLDFAIIVWKNKNESLYDAARAAYNEAIRIRQDLFSDDENNFEKNVDPF